VVVSLVKRLSDLLHRAKSGLCIKPGVCVLGIIFLGPHSSAPTPRNTSKSSQHHLGPHSTLHAVLHTLLRNPCSHRVERMLRSLDARGLGPSGSASTSIAAEHRRAETLSRALPVSGIASHPRVSQANSLATRHRTTKVFSTHSDAQMAIMDFSFVVNALEYVVQYYMCMLTDLNRCAFLTSSSALLLTFAFNTSC
jgi:hypothetical protein